MTIQLPGKNCGLCGSRSCDEFAALLEKRPELIVCCVLLDGQARPAGSSTISANPAFCSTNGCGAGACASCASHEAAALPAAVPFVDSLGREFDFYLEHFPEDPGPRETIRLHNPMLVRELDIKVGDVMIGRPLGMSCGCPVTHCGIAIQVDQRTGIMVWCVTGPLDPREKGFKDLGYYSAEAYEGIIRETRVPLRIGMRHYFQPRMCMLQWRHSGLINYVNRIGSEYQIRLEGLLIG